MTSVFYSQYIPDRTLAGVEGRSVVDLTSTSFADLMANAADYSSATQYQKGAIVYSQNSTWVYVNATAGSNNPPPTLPTISNAYWELLGTNGTFTWIAYANSTNGTTFTDFTTGAYDTSGIIRKWIGIAPNKTTAVESTTPADYSWTKIVGEDGAPGSTTATVNIFQRGTSAPTLPSASTTYTFGNPPSLTGLNNGWVTSIAATTGTSPLYVASATASSNTGSDTIAPNEWSSPVVLASNGTNGLSVATVFLYRRTTTASPPGVITTGTATFTFSNGTITNQPADWQRTVPSSTGGPFLWVIQATASNTTATDDIANTEWTAPSLISQDGPSGLNSATIFLYQRSATPPTAPTGPFTYTFSTGALTGAGLGSWTQTIPTGTDPLYVITATASSTTTTDNIETSELSAVRLLAQSGAPGSPGANTAIVYLYRRRATAPTAGDLPTGTFTYTFSNANLVTDGSFNSWTQAIPSGTDPLYVIAATATSNTTTDTFPASEFSSAVVLAQNGLDGSNNATITLYQRSPTAPSAPNGNFTYTFATRAISPSIGTSWTLAVPAGTDPLYVTTANASSNTATATITFSAPVLFVQNGTPGTSPLVYEIVTSTPVIVKDAVDAATAGAHTSVTIQGRRYNGNVTTNFGWVTVTANGDTEATTATDTASAAFTLSPTTTAGKTSYTVRLYNQATVAGATLLDTQTIAVVFKGAAGAPGANARAVSLTIGAQAFAYNAAGTTPSPANTTATATAFNTSGTVFYEFVLDGTTVQNTTTNTYTYTPQAAFADMPDTLRVNIREGANNTAILASDTIAISGLRNSVNGVSALTTVMSNTAHTLPTTNTGVITYTGSGTTIRLFEGTTELLYDGVGTANGSWTVGRTGTNITPGATTDSGNFVTIGDHSAMTATNASVSYAITGKRADGTAISITLVQTLSRAVQGDNGTNAITAILSNESHVFPANSSGVVSSYTGSGTDIRVYEGATELSYDGVGTTNGTWTISSAVTNIVRGILTDNGASLTVGNHSGVADATDTSSIIYTITGRTLTGQTINLTRTQTFSKSRAGVNGVRGSKQFFASGTSWSDSVADAAITSPNSPKVLLDQVTISGTNFSQTRYWDGSSWIQVSQVVDGNLLVNGTVGANALTAGTILANIFNVGSTNFQLNGQAQGAGKGALIVSNGQQNMLTAGYIDGTNIGVSIRDAAGNVVMQSSAPINSTTASTSFTSAIANNSLSLDSVTNDALLLDPSMWIETSMPANRFFKDTDGTGYLVIPSGVGNDLIPKFATATPIDHSATYEAQWEIMEEGSGTPTSRYYTVVYCWDAAGTIIPGPDGTYWYYPSNFTTNIGRGSYERRLARFGKGTLRPFPSNAVKFGIGLLLNYNASPVVTRARRIRTTRIDAENFGVNGDASRWQLANNSAIRWSGVTGWNQTTVSSKVALSGAQSLSFDLVAPIAMCGLTDSVNPSGYADLDYAWYCETGGTIQIYESGINIWSTSGYTNVEDVRLRIEYDGNRVKYYINGNLARTVIAGGGKSFRAAVDCNTIGAGFRNIRHVSAETNAYIGENTFDKVGNPVAIEHIRNNLALIDWWKKGATIPWNTNGESNSIISVPADASTVQPPIAGQPDVWFCQEVTNDGNAGGGWHNIALSPLNPDKTYRFVVPIRGVTSSTFAGQTTPKAYWGTNNVANINTTTLNTNPYFAVVERSAMQSDRWYLFVGYIFPRNSTAKSNDSAGVWDCKTGQKISTGTNYAFLPDGSQPTHRAYQFYAGNGSQQMFGMPLIEPIESMSDLTLYFEDGARLNNAITIDANGNFINPVGTGSGTSVSNTLVAKRLVSRGSVATIIEGNTIRRSSGDNDYTAFVTGDPVTGACFAEAVIAGGGYTMIAFDTASSSGNYADQDFVIHASATAGTAVYRNGAYLGSVGSVTAGHLLRIVYDGERFQIFVNGSQVGPDYAAPSGQTLFPIFNAYNGPGSYIGLNYGPYSINSAQTKFIVNTPAGPTLRLIGSNTILRDSGGTDWNSQCYSSQGYEGGAFCSFVPTASNCYFMAGLNSDPTTNSSYLSIDYAFYMPNASDIRIYESGNGITAPDGTTTFGTWTADTVLSIIYDNQYIRYLINGDEVRCVRTNPRRKFFFDSSVYSGPAVSNIQFGPVTPDSSNVDFIHDSDRQSQRGNSVYKNSKAVGTWNSKSVSTQIQTGTAFVSGKLSTVNTFIGLKRPADAGSTNAYDSMQASFHRSNNGNWYTWSYGGDRINMGTTYLGVTFNSDTEFRITYDGVKLRWYANTTLVDEAAATPAETYAACAVVFASDNRVDNIQFGPYTDNAWVSVGGTGRPQDNANNTSVDGNGAIQGVSAGSGTTVANNQITISPSTGQISGIGSTGNGESVANNRNYIIRDPGGALSVDNPASVSGAIKIRLPQSWTSTMMRFTVDIYEYAAGFMCSMEIGGYNYGGDVGTGPHWVNVTARVLGGSNVEYPVYYGHDGTRCCVWIGSHTDTWSYPQIRVKDFLGGHSNSGKDLWASGWSISFDTTVLGAIASGSAYSANKYNASVTDTLPGADWSKTARRPGNLSVLTGNEGIQNSLITVNTNGQLTGIGTGENTVVQNTLIQVDANGNFVNTGATGNGTSISNTLVARRLVSAGSVAATIQGNTIIRASGNEDYNSFVYGEAISGSCFAEAIIAPNSWTMIAFDTVATTGSYLSQDFVVHANPASSINIYQNGTGLVTLSAPTAGHLLRVTYDGVKYQVFVNGTQVGANYAAPANQRYFPIFNAYNQNIRYSGLNYGPYTDNAWASVGGTGRPADNATVGAIAGTNLLRSNATVLNDNDIITSAGTAAAIANQTAWATYSTHAPADVAPKTVDWLGPRTYQDVSVAANGSARWLRVARVDAPGGRGTATVSISGAGGGVTPGKLTLEVSVDWSGLATLTILSASRYFPAQSIRLSRTGTQTYLDLLATPIGTGTGLRIEVIPNVGSGGIWQVNYVDNPSIGSTNLGSISIEGTGGTKLVGTVILDGGTVTSTLSDAAGGIKTNGTQAIDSSGNAFDVLAGSTKAVAERGANITETRTASGILNQAATATSSDFSAVTGSTKPEGNATNDRYFDRRNTNQAPNWYLSNYNVRTAYEFKDASVLGVPGSSPGFWGALVTTNDYADFSGGEIKQRFTYGSGVTAGTSYVRTGSGTTWTAWLKDFNGYLRPTFDSNDLLETGSTVATVANFKTSSGTAAGILNQGALATRSTTRIGTDIVDDDGTTVLTAPKLRNNRTDGSMAIVAAPEGGSLTLDAPSTGAIRIGLPAARRGSNTMMAFRVTIYDYDTNTSVIYEVGGYNYETGWINTFARALGPTNAAKPVRFGRDSTRDYIWIGNLDTVWQYPKVSITDLRTGYSNFAHGLWETGWQVVLTTSDFAGVVATYLEPNAGDMVFGINAKEAWNGVIATLPNFKTSQGTAAAIVNQGTGATANTLAQLDATAAAQLSSAVNGAAQSVARSATIEKVLNNNASVSIDAASAIFSSGGGATYTLQLRIREVGGTDVNVGSPTSVFIAASESDYLQVSGTFTNTSGGTRRYQITCALTKVGAGNAVETQSQSYLRA